MGDLAIDAGAGRPAGQIDQPGAPRLRLGAAAIAAIGRLARDDAGARLDPGDGVFEALGQVQQRVDPEAEVSIGDEGVLRFVMRIEKGIFGKLEKARHHRFDRFARDAGEFGIDVLGHLHPVAPPAFGGDPVRHPQHGFGHARNKARHRLAQERHGRAFIGIEGDPVAALQPDLAFSRGVLGNADQSKPAIRTGQNMTVRVSGGEGLSQVHDRSFGLTNGGRADLVQRSNTCLALDESRHKESSPLPCPPSARSGE